MKRGKSTGKPTKEEQRRLDAIHSMPCIACSELFSVLYQCSPTEAHHLVDKGYRKHSGGHSATIPLCAWHHRGIIPEGFDKSHMEYLFGPSFALSKRRFVQCFGTERHLLAITDERLKVKK